VVLVFFLIFISGFSFFCSFFFFKPVYVCLSKYMTSFSRKLLLLRQRDTVYTRSINGFSLRKFKVLSVGGSSLKWSKSIEKNSKKANEVSLAAVHADRIKFPYEVLVSNG
jgi:hypothetical protein